eukprot:1373229-Amorphochlora_amoeboformis.AAC.1
MNEKKIQYAPQHIGHRFRKKYPKIIAKRKIQLMEYTADQTDSPICSWDNIRSFKLSIVSSDSTAVPRLSRNCSSTAYTAVLMSLRAFVVDALVVTPRSYWTIGWVVFREDIRALWA